MEQAVFQLCYTQHGGSGLAGMNPNLVDDMLWGRFLLWCKLLEEQRSKEQAALEKAARKK